MSSKMVLYQAIKDCDREELNDIQKFILKTWFDKLPQAAFSITLVSVKTKRSRGAVKRAVNSLEKKGIVVRRGGGNKLI